MVKCGFVVAHVTSISLMFARLAPSPDVTRAGSNIQRMRAQSEHSLQPASTAQSGEPEQSDIVISINQEHSVRYRDKTCLVTRSSHVTFPYL